MTDVRIATCGGCGATAPAYGDGGLPYDLERESTGGWSCGNDGKPRCPTCTHGNHLDVMKDAVDPITGRARPPAGPGRVPEAHSPTADRKGGQSP